MIQQTTNSTNRRYQIQPSKQLRGHFLGLARQVQHWSKQQSVSNGHFGQNRQMMIGVASLEPNVGSSTISFNLACALSSMGKMKTLLIEANFGRHYVSRRLGHSKAPGLSELLLGVTSLEEAIFFTGIEEVSVIGAGTKSGQEALELPFDELEQVTSGLVSDFRQVVFDLPVASELTACFSLLEHLDGIVLAIDANQIDQNKILRFRKQVEMLGVEVIGVVLNKS